jgi:hypothetical protein
MELAGWLSAALVGGGWTSQSARSGRPEIESKQQCCWRVMQGGRAPHGTYSPNHTFPQCTRSEAPTCA